MNRIPESVEVEIRLGRLVAPGELNVALRGLGFVLYYDVYAFPRQHSQPWESETVLDLRTYRAGVEVDAQEKCDALVLIYPFATLPSFCISEFVSKVFKVSNELDGESFLNGECIGCAALKLFLVNLVSDVMREWGEEPGSEELAIMIEAQYGS